MSHVFVLVLPDREGQLARAARILSAHGLHVSRASFNKVIDVHTCFIEAEGPEEAIEAAGRDLGAAGMMVDQAKVGSVRMVELGLPADEEVLLPVLEMAGDRGLSITYLDARDGGEADRNGAAGGVEAGPGQAEGVAGVAADGEEAGAGKADAAEGGEVAAGPAEGGAGRRSGRTVRLGLYVDDEDAFDAFLRDARGLCTVSLPARDEGGADGHGLEVVDNNLFYVGYASRIAERFHLGSEGEQVLLVNMNRIIQNLERTSADPYKPFDYLGQFAETIDRHRGAAYHEACRTERFETAGGIRALSIEPPCGSTTWVFDLPETGGAAGEYFVIDTGYACYRDEWLETLRRELPDWDARRHELFLTHADVDHAGNCQEFGRVYAVGRVMDDFRFELQGLPSWRDRNPLFMPYDQITNLLTAYRPPYLDGFVCLGGRPDGVPEPICRALAADGEPARLVVGPLDFEVWEGAGGHVPGETVLIDRDQRLCVSGDIFINIHGQTKVQRRFNLLSPFLMTSVDSVPDLERAERRYLFGLLGPGTWQILGGHGPLFSYVKHDDGGRGASAGA